MTEAPKAPQNPENWAYKRLGIQELWRATGRLDQMPSARRRMTFYTEPAASYRRLNGVEPLRRGIEGVSETKLFHENCRPDGLDEIVKVVRFPVNVDHGLLRGAAADCALLRQEGHLAAMRGGRPTDLLRPLKPATATRVRQCQALPQLISRIESALAGTGLFLRSIKFDNARGSSTSKQRERATTNLHLDAERATPSTFSGSIRQIYLNLSPTPRHFLIVPVTLEEMLDELAGDDTIEEPVGETLQRFLDRFGVAVETISVPAFAMVLFDGRAFAHDAAKFEESSYCRPGNRLELAGEPDLIAALDALETNYQHVGYRPESPFLEDLATSQEPV